MNFAPQGLTDGETMKGSCVRIGRRIVRHEKGAKLLELARLLASTAEGLTLDEMADQLGVGRRTAERMRDAVREVFPQLEELDDPPTRRVPLPAGLLGGLFGRFNCLVAGEDGGEARSWRLDRIQDLELIDRPAAPPEGFSLQDFADESFGIYHGEVERVVLRISPERAADALAWRFHANQTVQSQDHGSVLVAFSAGRMAALAWHLFTWGDAVEILEPPSLSRVMVEELRRALARHEKGSGRVRP